MLRTGERSARPLHARLALTTQAVVALAVLLTVVVLLSVATAVAVVHRDLEQQYEQRALAIAHGMAAEPGLANLVTQGSPTVGGPVEQAADDVRRATGALYVVVTDDRGIRYSHPNAALIGERVSTSPDEALAGRDVMTIEQGTLGYSARGKVPLRDASGAVVGEVSVGIDIADVNSQVRKLALLLGLVALVPLALGLVGAFVLARRLRRSTLGLEPEEMADLVRGQAAVLGGVRDAVIAVDTRGRVTVANPQAERLLGHALERGERLADSGAPDEVVALFGAERRPRGVLRVLGGKVVLATRLPVERDGRDLGEVLILRDRSDLDHLARELEATRALTDALRAQAHEHTNRLHALTGLLHHGELDEASTYLAELTGAGTWVSGVDDPYLAGLLAAKSAAASEAGVALRVGESTWVDGTLTHPLDCVTVVANLLDNAIRAARTGARTPAWVEVSLLSHGRDLVVHVVDSGDGVPPELVDSLFAHGVSTRETDRPGHGIGLSLALHTARAHGGDIRLVTPSAADHGAVFEARLALAITGHVDGAGLGGADLAVSP